MRARQRPAERQIGARGPAQTGRNRSPATAGRVRPPSSRMPTAKTGLIAAPIRVRAARRRCGSGDSRRGAAGNGESPPRPTRPRAVVLLPTRPPTAGSRCVPRRRTRSARTRRARRASPARPAIAAAADQREGDAGAPASLGRGAARRLSTAAGAAAARAAAAAVAGGGGGGGGARRRQRRRVVADLAPVALDDQRDRVGQRGALAGGPASPPEHTMQQRRALGIGEVDADAAARVGRDRQAQHAGLRAAVPAAARRRAAGRRARRVTCVGAGQRLLGRRR